MLPILQHQRFTNNLSFVSDEVLRHLLSSNESVLPTVKFICHSYETQQQQQVQHYETQLQEQVQYYETRLQEQSRHFETQLQRYEEVNQLVKIKYDMEVNHNQEMKR